MYGLASAVNPQLTALSLEKSEPKPMKKIIGLDYRLPEGIGTFPIPK